MFLEFFVLILLGIASFIAGSRAPPAMKALGIALGVLPFAGLISMMVIELGQVWPVVVVVMVFANKLNAFHGLSPAGAAELQLENAVILSAMGGVLLVAMFAGILIEWPALGVTPEAVGRRFVTGGEWARRPQSALATGVIYFSAIGAIDTFLARRRGG